MFPKTPVVQPYGVKKIYLNCALWGKSIKLGTVIILVALIIFSYGPHLNIHGGGTLCPWGGRGHSLFVLVRKRLKNGKKAA